MAFTPLNNGLGVALTCSGTTGRVALPAVISQADAMKLFNAGVTPIYVVLGDSTVVSTVAGLAIPAGESIQIDIPHARGSGAPSYVAGITDGSFSAILVVTLGNDS